MISFMSKKRQFFFKKKTKNKRRRGWDGWRSNYIYANTLMYAQIYIYLRIKTHNNTNLSYVYYIRKIISLYLICFNYKLKIILLKIIKIKLYELIHVESYVYLCINQHILAYTMKWNEREREVYKTISYQN
jgi:hypothetical protein